jgi:hypothetical protein
LARILAKQQVVFVPEGKGQERRLLHFFLALLVHLAGGSFLPVKY